MAPPPSSGRPPPRPSPPPPLGSPASLRDERAILNPRAGDGRFTLTRLPPSATLAPFVAWHWIVRWNLDAPFQQETLPNPLVNVVVGDHQPGIWGPRQARFVADLTGQGWVIGALFHAGAFRAWFADDLAVLANTSRPLASLFDASLFDAALVDGAATAGAPTDAALTAAMEAMLLGALAPAARDAAVADPHAALARQAVELARADVSLARCDQLAAQLDLSPRSLERLFHRYVGVTAKWVLRRFRVQEACERVKSGQPAAWSQLAHELGYFDQSHFIHDFKAQVGRTPADYAALCAARGAQAP